MRNHTTYSVEKLFPTLIYFAELSDKTKLEIEEEMYGALEKINFEKKEEWPTFTHKLSNTTFQHDDIEEYNLKKFRKELDSHIKTFVSKNVYERGYKFHSSWFTHTSKNEFAHVHNHGSADLSGCYYLKTNGQDGSITFLNPNRLMETDFALGNKMLHSLATSPEEGKLLLFPAWLDHMVTENLTDNERISFSFNIVFNR